MPAIYDPAREEAAAKADTCAKCQIPFATSGASDPAFFDTVIWSEEKNALDHYCSRCGYAWETRPDEPDPTAAVVEAVRKVVREELDIRETAKALREDKLRREHGERELQLITDQISPRRSMGPTGVLIEWKARKWWFWDAPVTEAHPTRDQEFIPWPR